MKIKKFKPISEKKLYTSVGLFILITIGIMASLTSYKWSAYLYRIGDKGEQLLYVGEFSSEEKCKKYALKKLSAGVQFTRFDQANAFYCGKNCFEFPLGNLTKSRLFCMTDKKIKE